MKYYQYIIIILCISLCYNESFDITINKTSEYCVGEYLSEGTVVFASQEFDVTLYDPLSTKIYSKENQFTAVASLTAEKVGSHTMCIKNKSKEDITIQFDFASGINAKDYASIAKQSNLKPLEVNLKKLEDSIKYIIKEMSNIVKYQEKSLAVNDQLGGKIILFSCITMITMIIVGIVETVYIQKYLTNKKII